MTEGSPRTTLLPGLLLWALLLVLAGAAGYRFSPPPQANIPETTLQEVQLRFGLPPNLVQAVILAESGGRPRARSNRGAVGLMQLLPSTAQELARILNEPTPPDLENPETNIRLGSFYLARLLVRYQGDLRLALAAYNAGPTTIDRILQDPPKGNSQEIIDQGAPRETRAYVRRVLRFRKALENRKP